MKKFLFTLLLAFALLACQNKVKNQSEEQKTESKTQKEVVKIGAIIPLTGPVADMGESFLKGITLAKDNLPADTKYKYEVIIEDDQLTASKVASATQKLLNQDQVDALISTWSYGGNVAGPLASKKNLPHFATAWDPNILTYGSNNYLYLLSPRDFLPDFIKVFKAKNYQSIAILYFSEAGSIYCAKLLTKLAEQAGIKVVYQEEILSGEDFRSTSVKLKQAKPDIIFANLVGSELEKLLRRIKEQRIKSPLTTITGFDAMSDLSLAEGLWYISDSTPTKATISKLGLENYKKTTYGLGNYYDIINIIVHIYESWPGEGKPSNDWVNQEIAKLTDLDSAFGTVTMIDRVSQYSSLQYIKVKNGKRVLVKLKDLF